MTNLICVVIVTLATNWTTVSRTVPVDNSTAAMTYTVVRYAMLNQVGTRVTNYVALVEWKGKTNEVVLESVPDAKQEPLSRSIPEPNGGIILTPTMNCYPAYNPVLHWETNLFLDAN